MITGDDWIQLASRFAASDNGEATWRTSIGRAYYGAFHVSYEFLFRVLNLDDIRGKQDKHRRVRELLYNTGHKDAKMASQLLSSMCESRNLADYKIDHDRIGKQDAAKHQHGLALKVVQLLKACEIDAQSHAGMREAIEKFRTVNDF